MVPTRTAAVSLFALTSLFALAGPLAAQAPLTFTIDQAASNYTWTGTTSIGALQGVPNNNFQLTGSQPVVFTSATGQPLATGEFRTGGAATVVPNIVARVANPVPFLPPLATITIDNLSFELETPAAPIAGNGSFATLATVTVLTGMVTVVPLIGATSVSDLTGNQSAAQAFSGVFTQNGNMIGAISMQSTQFQFADPASGITATIDLTGTLVARHVCVAPVNYCFATPHSGGGVAAISYQGSVRLQDQSLRLTASSVPLNTFGFFLMSDVEASVPGLGGGPGNLCLGGSIVRLNSSILSSGTSGNVSLLLPFAATPPMLPNIAPGERWSFQYWFRDSTGGGPSSNTSNGLRVVFCP